MTRWTLAASVVLSITAAARAELSYNLPQTFAPIKADLAGGGQDDILVLGDSLSFRGGSYIYPFTSLLQSQYGNAGAGYQGFSLWTGGGFNSGWLTQGINEDMSPYHSLDGLWNQWTPTTGAIQGYFDLNNPTGQLQYLAQPGGGSFQINLIQGQYTEVQSLATIDTNSPVTEVKTYNYSLPSGYSRVDIIPAQNGPITILGAEDTLSSPGIRVDRAANGGWGVQDFLQRDASFDQQTKLLNPKLVMVWLGQNDQGYSQSGYETALNQLVDRIEGDLPDSQILLVGTYDQGSPNLPQLVAAMDDVAHQRDIGFLNMYEAGGDAAFFNASGYLDDGIHFSPAGGDYVSNILYQAFLSDGASLTPGPGEAPEPATLTLLAAGFAAIALKRRRHQG